MTDSVEMKDAKKVRKVKIEHPAGVPMPFLENFIGFKVDFNGGDTAANAQFFAGDWLSSLSDAEIIELCKKTYDYNSHLGEVAYDDVLGVAMNLYFSETGEKADDDAEHLITLVRSLNLACSFENLRRKGFATINKTLCISRYYRNDVKISQEGIKSFEEFKLMMASENMSKSVH